MSLASLARLMPRAIAANLAGGGTREDAVFVVITRKTRPWEFLVRPRASVPPEFLASVVGLPVLIHRDNGRVDVCTYDEARGTLQHVISFAPLTGDVAPS